MVELLLIAPFVFVVLYVVTTCFDFLRDRADKYARARARAGRAVPVPVVVLTDELRRGRAVRDGEDVRIHGRAVSVVLDRAELAASTVRRGQIDDQPPVRWCELSGFVDELGSPVFVGPPEVWEPAYEALVKRSTARAGRLAVLWAATPRPAVVAGAVALAAALLFQAVWWTGHDELATVARVEVDEEGHGSCSVRWDHGGSEHGAIVDCFVPSQDVDAITVRVLPWPLDGEAMDYEGSYETLSAITAGGAILLFAAGFATGVARARTPARRLTAMREEPRPKTGDGPSHDVRALTFRELARRVSTLEGWADEAHPAPPAPTGWQLVADAARSPVWWFVLPAIALAVLPEDMPGLLRVTILAVVVALVLRRVGLTLQVWRGWRDAADEPVTSEWDYVLVRVPSNQWCLLLLLGDTVHWSVVIGEGHPRGEGRCGVRGELGDGNDVRLVIEGETWIPEGPLVREDAESRREIRKDLEDLLQAATTREQG